MNFVGNDGESEPWKSFWFFVYMRTAEGTTSDSLVYLFGCYVFYWGGGNGDSLTGKEFCGKKICW